MKLVTLLFACLPLVSLAQIYVDGRVKAGNSLQYHRLVTKRGDVFYGNVRSYHNGKISFKAPGLDCVDFDYSLVDSIQFMPNPRQNFGKQDHAERGMFLPTAFSLKRGQWEYVNRNLLANSLNFGVRDHFTAGIGAMPLPNGFASWVNLKFATQLTNGIQVAGGGIMSFGKYNTFNYFETILNDSYRLVAPYGVITVGNRNFFVNLVASKGWTYQYGNPGVTDLLYGLSSALRLSNNVQVIAEWSKTMPPYYDENYLNLGFALMNKKRCLTLGVLKVEDYEGVVPSIGYSSKWMGKKFR